MKVRFFLTILLPAILIACSSDDSNNSGNNEVVNPMTNSSGTLSSKLSRLDFIKSESSSGVNASAAPDLDADGNWDSNTDFPDQACSGGSCSMVSTKDYMGNEIDADSRRDNGSDISVVGRVQGAMRIMCAMGVALGNSSGYPENTGSEGESFEFTPALKAGMESQCDFADVNDLEDGTKMNIVIEDAETSTNYDKKATIDLSELNGGTQIYYFRASSSVVNVATAENYNHEGTDYTSRTVVFYDVTNDILKGEYVSGPQSGTSDYQGPSGEEPHMSFYRLYYDEGEDNGYILSARGQDQNDGPGTTFHQTMFVLAGKPNTTGGLFSLSLISNYLPTTSLYEGCVNASDGSMNQDGARCSDTSQSLSGGSVSGSFLEDFLDDYQGANYSTVSADTALEFSNETDVLTADPAGEL